MVSIFCSIATYRLPAHRRPAPFQDAARCHACRYRLAPHAATALPSSQQAVVIPESQKMLPDFNPALMADNPPSSPGAGAPALSPDAAPASVAAPAAAAAYAVATQSATSAAWSSCGSSSGTWSLAIAIAAAFALVMT